MRNRWTQDELIAELTASGFLFDALSQTEPGEFLLSVGVDGDPRLFQVTVHADDSLSKTVAAVRAEIDAFPPARVSPASRAAFGD